MKQLTDEELIKTFKYCYTHTGRCPEDCPLYKDISDYDCDFEDKLLDLINRQKAEIERLNEERQNIIGKMTSSFDKSISETKSEAYQDFASALICEITSLWGCNPQYYVGSKVKIESALAKNDVETIEMIRRLCKNLQEEIE